MRRKVPFVAVVSPEVREEFQLILLKKYGYVSGNISPTVESILKEWIEKNRGVIANEEHG
ncbi:MAG: hypothetical protein QW315_04150 [Candidatus Hadarchaeum sp.]